MTTIDTTRLLQEIPGETPCGPNLRYEPAFLELQQAAQGRRGDGIVGAGSPAEGPDWRVVRRQAEELLSRTKDLRVATLFTKAMLHTEGVLGLQAGVELIRQLLEQYWDFVHPRLDLDDDNDPTMRLNILRELCDRDGFLLPLRSVPLVSLPALGAFGLRQIALATGELKLPAESTETPPSMDAIDGAFRNCDLEALRATAGAAAAALAELKAIEAFVTGKVGLGNALRLAELIDVLTQIGRVLGPRLAARGDDGVTSDGPEPVGGGVREVAIGSVSNREDVVRLLDKICEYYERHEPSSPIPILLRRCKRLVPMQFTDIVKELVPDGLPQFEVIRGPENTGEA